MNEHNTATLPEKEHAISLSELDISSLAIPPEWANGWCELDQRGCIAVSGEEAESFLQGQLTQDMSWVKKGQSLLAAHCTPKGRILFLFRCCFWRNQFYLDLPAELEAQALKRLTMYKLRAKVTLQSESDRIARTAFWGEEMRALLQRNGWDVPEQAGSTVQQDEAMLCSLGEDRWIVLSSIEYAAHLRAQLDKEITPSPIGWQIACVRAGEPEVIAHTSDEWIPQMLNLDHLQGVSFKKGCYTGQEIVARAHFLGRVKRRMRLFAYHALVALEPGQKVRLSSLESDGRPTFSRAIETPESEEEQGDTAQVVRSVELHPHNGWVLAVTKIPAENAPTET